MQSSQLIRRLRIAASLFFATLAVALCVLWVRSYWYHELVLCSFDQNFVLIVSQPGGFGFSIIPEESVDPWIIYRQPASEWWASEEGQWRAQSWGGFYINFRQTPIVVAPYWFWLLIPATLAALFWRNPLPRFSLRTLLIATMLVAVVLGLGVWLAS
jgi:hypothetical protein